MPQIDDSSYCSVSIDQLTVGIRLRSTIYEVESSVLLISAGTNLTQQHVLALIRRGITHVRAGLADLKRPTKPIKQPSDEKDQSKSSQWSNGKSPFLKLHTKKQRQSNPQKSKLAQAFNASFSTSIFKVSDCFGSLASGKSVSGAEITEMLNQCLAQILEDIDLFVSMQADQDTAMYPVSHSIQTARLAMAVGAVMGVDKESLCELGSGCLLHDVGMLRVPPDLLNSERPLNQIEKLDITKHPAYTFDMIKDIADLSVGARMVAYQMHERLDGSGYPRRVTGRRIHPYAKIAMVADTYVAMTSPRPHRPPILPYYAVLELLEETAVGRFDREVMTGFLDTVSLFPIGSAVELNDGKVGTVLRANPGQYTKPVVEVWTSEDPDNKSVIDLTEKDDLQIIRTLLDV